MKHPYIAFEGTDLWRKVEVAVNSLISNGDLQLTTNVEYVIGYLCKELASEDSSTHVGTGDSNDS